MLTDKQKIEVIDKLLAKQEIEMATKRYRKVHHEFPRVDFRNNKDVYLDADKRMQSTVTNSWIVQVMRGMTVYELNRMGELMGEIQ